MRTDKTPLTKGERATIMRRFIEGATFFAIARDMGRPIQCVNGCVGHLRRLGVHPKVARPEKKKRGFGKLGSHGAPTINQALLARKGADLRVRLMDAREFQCRNPVDGEGARLIVCGAPVVVGKPYCAACYAVNYSRYVPPGTAEANAPAEAVL